MFGRIVRTEVYADGALAAIDVARDRVRASGYVPTYTVSRPYRLGSDRWRIELAVRKDR